jgi:hypothetical protein
MPSIVVFYWEPGSCGDFVNQLFLERPSEYQGVIENTILTDQGRVSPRLTKFFVENFSSNPNQWYLRDWSTPDCDKLLSFVSNLNCKYFVLPTHRLDQVSFLKSQFKNSTSIGITYSDNMFPLVLKNWCKKVSASEPNIQKIYNSPLHQNLRLKNKFGEFMLTQQLTYGTGLRSKVENIFDVEISLEDIYNSDLSALKALFRDNSHVDHFFNIWIQHQSKIHSGCFDVPDIIKHSLGYNSKSKTPGDLTLCLDTFDNILIRHRHGVKGIPNFKTLQQAADFFKHSSAGR